MAKPFQQSLGQMAQGYLNYFSSPGNNQGNTNSGGYEQYPPQGPAAYSPYNSPSYHSNEPTPLLPPNSGYGGGPPGQSPTYNPSYAADNKPGSRIAFRRFTKFRRYLKIVLTLSKCVSALLSALMEGSMLYMMYKFQTTRHIHGDGRSSPWAADTKTWPTIVLAVGAGFTFVITVFSLIFQLCRSRKGGKKSKSRRWLTVAKYSAHIGSWAVIALMYRMGKTGEDLWGWSCSDKAKSIQDAFKSDVNFAQLCSLQGNSWILSLSETGGKVLFAIVAWIFHRQTEGARSDLVDDLGNMVADQLD